MTPRQVKAPTNARAAAALIVAVLEDELEGLTKTALQEAIDVGPFTFGRVLAQARLADYVKIQAGGVVILTPKGRSVLAEGRATLEAEQDPPPNRAARRAAR